VFSIFLSQIPLKLFIHETAIIEKRVIQMMSRGRDLIGKVIVSEETGRKFGVVGDINFVAESGELLNLVLVEPTKHIGDLTLEKDEQNRLLIPFSSVKSVGDFVIISEKEIV
jgi:sporulation protein YlmC with PRC-barrel domain